MNRTPGNEAGHGNPDGGQLDQTSPGQSDPGGDPNRNLEEWEQELRNVPGHGLGQDGVQNSNARGADSPR